MSAENVTRRAYLTDLTDDQWAIVEPLIPGSTNYLGGRVEKCGQAGHDWSCV